MGPHRFVCLSDVAVPCERILLEDDLPGWWSKIELFRPGLFDGPVLYLDLDVLVLGDLSPLFAKRFTITRDWWGGGYQSSVMSWGEPTGFYEAFRPEHMEMAGGDQAFLEKVAPTARIYPDGLVVSYKAHCANGPPLDSRVVCFHGRPKQWDVMDEWVQAAY